MELLAPAGTVDHFFAALDAGADAVYVGAPALNARNPGREPSLDDIGAMTAAAHRQGKKLYVALNSLVRERDLAELVGTLARLGQIRPDALIVQDLGVIDLAARFFPALALHGSTLMLTHNRESAAMLAGLGCSRAVLARELTLPEIETIATNAPLEIEVFVHGAMCYSYSGTCLFSSYLGGKSGLRGNCVQPCRRRYGLDSGSSPKAKKGKQSGYFFSLHDLEGIAFVKRLEEIGVAALKIEGRLRSTNYVENVVAAYRLVMDAGPDQEAAARRRAAGLLDRAMGRSSSAGFFISKAPDDLISQHHSGNVGIHLGRVDAIRADGNRLFAVLRPKHEVHPGDRLRLHSEKSGERFGFTVKEVAAAASAGKESDDGGTTVKVALPDSIEEATLKGKLELYLVDVSRPESSKNRVLPSDKARGGPGTRQVRRRRDEIMALLERPGATGKRKKRGAGRGRAGRRERPEIWLRLDSARPLFTSLPFSVDRVVVPIDRRTLAETGRLRRRFSTNRNAVVWALPAVVHDNDAGSLRKAIATLQRSGFRSFQIGHLSQLELFSGERSSLYGDYTLNLLNSRALQLAGSLGLAGVQFSIETDRVCLRDALSGIDPVGGRRQPSYQGRPAGLFVGLTVYGAPPLFISRLETDRRAQGRPILSPKNEAFVVTRSGPLTITRPRRPFSLLPWLSELAGFGVGYAVIDLSGLPAGSRQLAEIGRRLDNREERPRLPAFNYNGTLG